MEINEIKDVALELMDALASKKLGEVAIELEGVKIKIKAAAPAPVLAAARSLDLVHDLHGLDDAEGVALPDLLADQNERRFIRRGRRIKRADERTLDLRTGRKIVRRRRFGLCCCGCRR